MTLSIRVALSIGGLLACPAIGAAQNPGDITFAVPIALTQLSNGVSKIRVTCGIVSDAIAVNREVVGKNAQSPTTGPGSISVQSQEIPVTNGEVKTTATLVVATAGVLDNPIGKSANYQCTLDGFSVAQQRFMPFNYAFPIEGTEPALRLTVAGGLPFSPRLAGTFTW